MPDDDGAGEQKANEVQRIRSWIEDRPERPCIHSIPSLCLLKASAIASSRLQPAEVRLSRGPR